MAFPRVTSEKLASVMGVLRPSSLKISFQLAKRNKTLPCGQLGLERRGGGEAAVWIASRGGATAWQTPSGSQGNGKDQLVIALTLSPDIYRPSVKRDFFFF